MEPGSLAQHAIASRAAIANLAEITATAGYVLCAILLASALFSALFGKNGGAKFLTAILACAAIASVGVVIGTLTDEPTRKNPEIAATTYDASPSGAEKKSEGAPPFVFGGIIAAGVVFGGIAIGAILGRAAGRKDERMAKKSGLDGNAAIERAGERLRAAADAPETPKKIAEALRKAEKTLATVSKNAGESGFLIEFIETRLPHLLDAIAERTAIEASMSAIGKVEDEQLRNADATLAKLPDMIAEAIEKDLTTRAGALRDKTRVVVALGWTEENESMTAEGRKKANFDGKSPIWESDATDHPGKEPQ
jgi:hypothetical protein